MPPKLPQIYTVIIISIRKVAWFYIYIFTVIYETLSLKNVKNRQKKLGNEVTFFSMSFFASFLVQILKSVIGNTVKTRNKLKHSVLQLTLYVTEEKGGKSESEDQVLCITRLHPDPEKSQIRIPSTLCNNMFYLFLSFTLKYP